MVTEAYVFTREDIPKIAKMAVGDLYPVSSSKAQKNLRAASEKPLETSKA